MLNNTDRKELDMQMDMIRGNLNRMCTSETKEELDSMYDFAKQRLDYIYELNTKRLEVNDEADN